MIRAEVRDEFAVRNLRRAERLLLPRHLARGRDLTREAQAYVLRALAVEFDEADDDLVRLFSLLQGEHAHAAVADVQQRETLAERAGVRRGLEGDERLVECLSLPVGRACAPGPFLPTVIASAVIDACGNEALRAELLPGLADGSVIGGVAMDGELVLGGQLADIVVESTGQGWVLHRAPQLTPRKSIDVTRRVALLSGSPTLLDVGPDGVMGLVAAECAGGAAWCVETAAE